MLKRWRIATIILLVFVGVIVINGQLTRRYARNYVIHVDMLHLYMALGQYAKSNDDRLPTSWTDLEAMNLVILGEKSVAPMPEGSTVNRIERSDRCHWVPGASVKEYARILSSRPAEVENSLLLYSDDLSTERNMIYNRLLIKECGFQTLTGNEE